MDFGLILLKISLSTVSSWLRIKLCVPCVFGVLTRDNMDQALNRAGGKSRNKGVEAALTADKRKDVVQNVIAAAMNSGKDVSFLLTDVGNCLHTKDLELKNLIYSVINYAKSQPVLVILDVDTFV